MFEKEISSIASLVPGPCPVLLRELGIWQVSLILVEVALSCFFLRFFIPLVNLLAPFYCSLSTSECLEQ